MTYRVIEGDCIEVMAAMDEASVDAVVCDPPYGLEFMGKDWDRLGAVVEPFDEATVNGQTDYHGKGNAPFGGGGQRVRYGASAQTMQVWHTAWAVAALRVLKPGGHLLAFGGTRTYHRLACALEDAGFEIRDCLAWLYGSGFPKSLDVSKAIDKAAGAEREVVGNVRSPFKVDKAEADRTAYGAYEAGIGEDGYRSSQITAPATPDAERWQGWGTALKPAFEPIVLARKPLVGTVAANVLEHGTGALNVDGTRIKIDDADRAVVDRRSGAGRDETADIYAPGLGRDDGERFTSAQGGRWPANVILDEDAAALLDEQTGESASRIGKPRGAAAGDGWGMTATGAEYDDFGGASRFFYCPKADREERNRGLGHHAPAFSPTMGDGIGAREHSPDDARSYRGNTHPTVKPVELMRWLCRLVTPPGGTVLDPFTGSGTTGIAALREGFEFIGIEREPEYVQIARDRIFGDAPLFNVEEVPA